MQQHGFGPAQLPSDVAIAHRLASLLLQRQQLAFQCDYDVVQPGEIGFRRAQAQLGLVPARVKARDAGGLLQQRAPIGWLGVDEGADAALADEGGGMRPGGGIGEQQLDVARPGLAAVHLIAGAGAAVDAPAHLQGFELVEHRRHLAVGIVEQDLDLGDIARRARRIAGEYDVVHLAAAHALGRGLAHDPAQRLDEIGFAAAVGADNSGKPRRDDEFGRIDEGLEAGETKFAEVDQSQSYVRNGRARRRSSS